MRMRYRLIRGGSDSLRDYLKQRFVISQLADKIGIANNSLHAILNGERNRPNPGHLEALAKITNLLLKYDDDGPYFEEKPETMQEIVEYQGTEQADISVSEPAAIYGQFSKALAQISEMPNDVQIRILRFLQMNIEFEKKYGRLKPPKD